MTTTSDSVAATQSVPSSDRTLRQAVLHQPNDLRIEEVPMPSLEPGDVLLRVDAALLCGTDVRIYEGRKQKNVTFPSVLGHEFAGTVVDANGPLPDGVAMGDQVAVYPLVTCGSCVACRKGHENICRNRKAFGYQLTGGLSQFVRVPAVARQNLVPVPGVPAAEAAIIEPVACAYNGQKLAGMSRAETALIVGCGPLGLIHTGLAKSLGVERVAAVDPIDKRRAMASRFGADLVLEPGPNAADQLNEFSDGGIDVLVMAIGRIDALTPIFGLPRPRCERVGLRWIRRRRRSGRLGQRRALQRMEHRRRIVVPTRRLPRRRPHGRFRRAAGRRIDRYPASTGPRRRGTPPRRFRR